MQFRQVPVLILFRTVAGKVGKAQAAGDAISATQIQEPDQSGYRGGILSPYTTSSTRMESESSRE